MLTLAKPITRSDFPHLLAVSDKPDWHTGRVAAENIRRELKQAFPGFKFSVTFSSYSMGNSIDVTWTDGPTSKAVQAITDKYAGGSFDGMTDCYEYARDHFNDLFGSGKYVHANRRETLEGVRKAWQATGRDPAEVCDGWCNGDGYGKPWRNEIFQAWSNADLR